MVETSRRDQCNSLPVRKGRAGTTTAIAEEIIKMIGDGALVSPTQFGISVGL